VQKKLGTSYRSAPVRVRLSGNRRIIWTRRAAGIIELHNWSERQSGRRSRPLAPVLRPGEAVARRHVGRKARPGVTGGVRPVSLPVIFPVSFGQRRDVFSPLLEIDARTPPFGGSSLCFPNTPLRVSCPLRWLPFAPSLFKNGCLASRRPSIRREAERCPSPPQAISRHDAPLDRRGPASQSDQAAGSTEPRFSQRLGPITHRIFLGAPAYWKRGRPYTKSDRGLLPFSGRDSSVGVPARGSQRRSAPPQKPTPIRPAFRIYSSSAPGPVEFSFGFPL
jgi:hypothetical protein